ncbi:lipid phosphate phosphatase beta [Artemisia annua]|uniref:Lipid phosphate phosphatase beta n=1 Tax=Artemisia annua TaxID=35608 RepID=A0A2U1KXG3_ARTAN|nr:lipid phosphate phosphatase beta [Artemisia annua]
MFLSFSVDQYSFPSGHASRVSFIASLICFYEDVDVLLFGSVSVCLIVWASVTSVSRVLLGRHFVFDVVVGGAIGVANAVFVFRYFNCFSGPLEPLASFTQATNHLCIIRTNKLSKLAIQVCLLLGIMDPKVNHFWFCMVLMSEFID